MALRHSGGILLSLAAAAACGTSSGSSGIGPSGGGDGDGATASGSSGSSSSSGGSSGSSGGGSTDSSISTTGNDASTMTADAPPGSASTSPETGTILDGDAGTCPAPGGLSANTAAALTLVNQTRSAMGSPCATMVAALNTSASKHCAYYAANQPPASATCIADPHVEVSGCADFVAAQFNDRETAAGYTGYADSETMAFDDSGTGSVQQWIDSVWHRTPVLSPWTRDIGYGSATACDTMDFGVGSASPSDLIVTYPYDGQTGVPTSFNGTYEGPMPPAPPGGWPSGYPVHVYLHANSLGTTITTHEFSVDGGAQLAHQWITPQTPNAVLQDAVVLYANAPLTANTRYRVHVAGTGANGAAVDVNVTFTTK